MLDIIRNIYRFSKTIIKLLEKRGPFNKPWCGWLYIILMMLLFFEIKLANKPFQYSFIFGILGCYTFFIAFWAFLLREKVPKLVSKDHQMPIELFQEFSHRSFLYGICWFSLEETAAIYAILYYLEYVFTGNLNRFMVYDYIIPLYYCICSLFAICWFSYHIVIGGIPTKEAKTQLTLYTAIATTFSFIVVSPIFGIFKMIIAALGIGFVWVNHLISAKEYEDSMKSTEHHI